MLPFKGIPVLHERAVFSVANLENNFHLASLPVDQTPGHSGVIIGSEGVVWKCSGCRASNHTSNITCGNCRKLKDGPSAPARRSFAAIVSAAEREKLTALVNRKLTCPHLYLSMDEGVAVFKHCFEQDEANIERISGKTAVLVVGNAGIGSSSTFLNFFGWMHNGEKRCSGGGCGGY